MTENASSPRGQTPSQTVGPFFAYCLTPSQYSVRSLFSGSIATPNAVGERITVSGRVLDGNDAPVPDAVVEIWQADGAGRLAGYHEGVAESGFTGFGRVETDAAGHWRFETVKPGRVAGPAGALQAPHLALTLFARGLLRQLVTRIYFEDEAANAGDPVLALVPIERRPTLIARRDGAAYAFDIRLQGEGETVFFDA